MAYRAFANITDILGMPALTKEYRAKAAAVAQQINDKFLDRSTGAYNASTGFRAGPLGVSQCGQGMALFMGLVPQELRADALAVLAANVNNTAYIKAPAPGNDAEGRPYTCTDCDGGPGPHMTAGLFGIKWFLQSLADGSMNDLAYAALTARSYPGFKWMMHNSVCNATTIWESWFFSSNTFSHNHPMFSSSEVWLLQSVAGIQPHPAAKGFDRVLIKPSPPTALEHASASFDSLRGRIQVRAPYPFMFLISALCLWCAS